MKTTGIKTGPFNQGQKSSKKEQAKKKLQEQGDKMPMKDKLVGGAGGLGIVGGAGFKAAKGAIQVVKNLLTRGSKPKNIVKSIFKKKRTTSITNPIPGSTKAYNKLQYPMGKKAFSSKPVDFKGPNPAHNIGAGGNSYPR